MALLSFQPKAVKNKTSLGFSGFAFSTGVGVLCSEQQQ